MLKISVPRAQVMLSALLAVGVVVSTGRPLAAQQWVSAVLVPPPVPAQPVATPSSGYLRVTVTSNLDPLIDAKAFEFDKRFGLLSADVELTVPGNTPIAYPIAAWNVTQRQQVTLAAFQLGEAQYVNLESGTLPTVSVVVRAIPTTLAGAVSSALKKFDQLATNPVVSGFIPIPSQVTALTGMITSVIQSEPQQWESKQSMSLNLGSAGLQALPIGSTPAVVFLRSTKRPKDVPDWSQLQMCSGAVGVLCLKSGERYKDMPYFLITAQVEDYRPITDFRVPSLNCASTQQDLNAVSDAVRRSPLTEQQRFAEQRLLSLFELNVGVQPRLMQMSSAADLAYRWANRPTSGDAYWTRRAAPRAALFEGCFNTAVSSLGAVEGRRWNIFSAAFGAAKTFDPAKVPNDAGRKAMLEGVLDVVTRPIIVYKLDNGEAYGALRDTQERIERLLIPDDAALAASAGAATGAAQLQALRKQLATRFDETYCARCREVLAPALEAVNRKIAALPADPSAVAALAANRQALATTQQEGVQVAAVASTLNLDAGQRAALSQQLQAASQVLGNPNSDASQIQQAITVLENQIRPLRQAATQP